MSSKTTAGQGGMASDTTTPANANLGGDRSKVFDKQGVIGKQFTGMSALSPSGPSVRLGQTRTELTSGMLEQGAVGGTAQAIGGPLDKDGVIGKQFKSDGAIGGMVQDTLGGSKPRSN